MSTFVNLNVVNIVAILLARLHVPCFSSVFKFFHYWMLGRVLICCLTLNHIWIALNILQSTVLFWCIFMLFWNSKFHITLLVDLIRLIFWMGLIKRSCYVEPLGVNRFAWSVRFTVAFKFLHTDDLMLVKNISLTNYYYFFFTVIQVFFFIVISSSYYYSLWWSLFSLL